METISEEETLAQLSGHVSITVTHKIEQQPLRPAPKNPLKLKTKRKQKPFHKLTQRGKIQRRMQQYVKKQMAQMMMDPEDDQQRNDFTSVKWPTYKMTSTATIFGKEFTVIHKNLLPHYFDSAKDQVRHHIESYIIQATQNRRLGKGATDTTEVKVTIPQ